MSKTVNEEKLLAIIYSNFSGKGKQHDDWIYIAETLKKLKQIYKSDKKLAENLNLSREIVRSTIRLLDLPPEVKSLIKKGKLSQDLGWRLLGIKNERNQLKVAKAIIGLSAHDARDMIRFAKNKPEKSISGQIERLKKSKKPVKDINILVLPLEEHSYQKLKEIAKKKGINMNVLVSKILSKELEKISD